MVPARGVAEASFARSLVAKDAQPTNRPAIGVPGSSVVRPRRSPLVVRERRSHVGRFTGGGTLSLEIHVLRERRVGGRRSVLRGAPPLEGSRQRRPNDEPGSATRSRGITAGFQIAVVLAKSNTEAKSHAPVTSRAKCREQSGGNHPPTPGGVSIRRAAVSRFAARTTQTAVGDTSCPTRGGRRPLQSPCME
jgi:hypothetical protein